MDQAWLLPPSLHDCVPARHGAHLVREMVRESLDLPAILMDYPEERGQPPYHPALMTALLLYADGRGVDSSRKMAKACEERLDFMAVTGLQKPDFRTIADFRKRHLGALSGLFGHVLGLCRAAGLVTLGHVALDGTKIKANASKHKAMSYARMVKAEAELSAEVETWLAQADAGYCSQDNLEALAARAVRGYIATGRQKHGAAAAVGPRAAPPAFAGAPADRPGSLRAAMATRLKRGGRRSRYRLRKITVEPVFGQTKEARGFRQFLQRGLDKVAHEWGLVCIAHNHTKLAAAAA